MANLIEQMNALKGLTDEHLQGELKAPSGSAPPFLVASEIGRRQDARKRYEQETARMKPRTTVAEDLERAAPSMGGMGDMSGGIAPMPADTAPPVQGFADGGIVNAIDYNDIAKRYNDRLTGLGGEKDRARAMALLAASAGILGGGHQNTLQNLGAGIDAGVKSYDTALHNIDSEEMDLLRGIADIGQAQNTQANAAADRDYRERALAQERDLAEKRMGSDNMPASAREFEYYQGLTPEQKKEYERLNPGYNPNAITNDMRTTQALNDAYDIALKSLPKPTMPAFSQDDIQKQALEMQRQAAILAYPKWVTIAGKAAADAQLAQYGLSPNDLLVGGGAGDVDSKDPLGLGL